MGDRLPTESGHTDTDRIDRAEQASSLAVWRAAVAAGYEVDILDEPEFAAAAAPALPGPIFNTAYGVANFTERLDRAVALFRDHESVGWVWASEAPWPMAVVDSTAVYAAAPVERLVPRSLPDTDVTIREVGRHETGDWARVVVEAAELRGDVAQAWRDLEPALARGPSFHRFIAELDGRPVGTGAIHIDRDVGWLRAGTAGELGCDLVGASADSSSISARNLERLGFEIAATRQRVRINADSPA